MLAVFIAFDSACGWDGLGSEVCVEFDVGFGNSGACFASLFAAGEAAVDCCGSVSSVD
ncbi:hypothetical protein ACWPKO_15605 [Coraliomargarita sp. W4R53]